MSKLTLLVSLILFSNLAHSYTCQKLKRDIEDYLRANPIIFEGEKTYSLDITQHPVPEEYAEIASKFRNPWRYKEFSIW